MENCVDFDEHLHGFQTIILMVHFCKILITFASILDPDQENVRADLDPNCLSL